MTEQRQQQLYHQARKGKRSAFDSLQKALEPSVKRFIQRLVGNIHTVEDITQDAFLALYMNLKRLDSSEHLRPFLFRVVRNRCYTLKFRRR